MRRIRILFFWLFLKKNNVSLRDLVYFLTKPKINKLAKKYLRGIAEEGDLYKAFFDAGTLYWPKTFSLDRLDQVICETFDKKDWHYYQWKHTPIEQGEILLDIGTAEGLFSLCEVNKCSHIHLVEPSHTFMSCLEKTFEPYRNKVTIHNVAIGNEDGTVAFSEDSLDGKIALGNKGNTKETPIRKIDSIIQGRVTYLKADIEGFELEMLKGAEQTIKINKPKIAITTYHDENNPDEIIALIKSFVPEYNYHVKGIYEANPKPVLIHFWI